MFVLFKDINGKGKIRPAFIGFIKNDKARRVMMIIYWPITLLVTMFVNYLLLCACFVGEISRLTIAHTRMLKIKPWNDEVWNKPREK